MARPFLSNGFLPDPPTAGSGTVTSVTAADASITVAGTATDPTVAVGTVPAANVKHRYVIGNFRTTNKPASSSTALLYGGDLSYPSPRAVTIVQVGYYGSSAAAGSNALIEISLDGGSTWATLVTVVVGEVSFAKAPAATFNIPKCAGAATETRIRCTTDGSWTSTTADPNIVLEVEET